MMMVVDTNYAIGDMVYLKTDKEQLPRIVTGINIRISGFWYVLQNGVTESCHYEIELSKERDLILKSE